MIAYVQGDQAAFKALFERLAPRVHAFFMRSFKNRALADDLTQATFLKVHRGRETFNESEALRPWLFTIAARVRIDQLRRHYRVPEDATEGAILALEQAENADPSPLDHLENASRDAMIREAIDRLPESQRAVIHLHRFEGLSFAEIGRVLGSSEGAVRIRAFRAYASLRKLLSHLVEEPE